MSIVIDFPDRRAQQLRPEILDLLADMDDTVEIALDRLKRGDNPADILGYVYRTGASFGRRSERSHPDPQAARALGAMDELAARRAQREGGDAS